MASLHMEKSQVGKLKPASCGEQVEPMKVMDVCKTPDLSCFTLFTDAAAKNRGAVKLLHLPSTCSLLISSWFF